MKSVSSSPPQPDATSSSNPPKGSGRSSRKSATSSSNEAQSPTPSNPSSENTNESPTSQISSPGSRRHRTVPPEKKAEKGREVLNRGSEQFLSDANAAVAGLQRVAQDMDADYVLLKQNKITEDRAKILFNACKARVRAWQVVGMTAGKMPDVFKKIGKPPRRGTGGFQEA